MTSPTGKLTFGRADISRDIYRHFTISANTGTNLLTSRLAGDRSKIYQREFRTYNEEHLLVEILTDDGCEAAKEDYTGVTCQKFTCITPRLDGRAVGFPQTIVEGYIDLSTGQRMPLKRIEHIYDERELLVEQRIFKASAAKHG